VYNGRVHIKIINGGKGWLTGKSAFPLKLSEK